MFFGTKMERISSTGHTKSQPELELPPEKVNWSIALKFLVIHLGALYSLMLTISRKVHWATFVFAILLVYVSCFSITIGAHRLWAHRSYKAKWPLRLFLALCQVLTIQGSIRLWVSWHRAHHKYTEQPLDPHNAQRGFFYAHIGWILMYNPARFKAQIKDIYMGDLDKDPVVVWQDRNIAKLTLLIAVLMPIIIPWYFFGEDYFTGFYVCVCLRLVLSLHFTFLVNSAAHLYGYKPYDKNIHPAENPLVSLAAVGEGWHNYHHAFPWDYRASESGGFYRFNPSAAIIDFCAKIGLVYDRKAASPGEIATRMKRTGLALGST